MFDIVIVVLVIVLIVLIIIELCKTTGKFSIGKTKHVRSIVDGLNYKVHISHDNPTGAADTMAELNNRCVDLMRHLRNKYLRSEHGKLPQNARRVTATRRLLELYSPDNLTENSPKDPHGDTSYTIDKGKILAICLRGKSDSKIHDIETLTFVAVHELSHIAIKELDHPPIFWIAFKFMLEEAVECGVLYGINYKYQPAQYCGLKVDYNPLFDPYIERF